MSLLKNHSLIASGILIILYTVGVFGIQTQIHPNFILLTPINLLISLGLILWTHTGWSRKFIGYLIFSFCWGLAAEIFGVQTGLIFGDYVYGKVLGPKIGGAPFMIGVNWMMLSYAAGIAINYLLGKRHWILKGVAGALLLTALDVLIEPVAIFYDFWSWEQGVPPLQNYLGWFIIALPLQLLFARYFGTSKNKVCLILFILQIAFFAILGLLA